MAILKRQLKMQRRGILFILTLPMHQYQKLPIFIQFFMSKNAIAKKLEEWYIQVKDLLDNGVMDDSAKIGEAKDIE